MAYTIPTGYVYWDASAQKSYTAGKTFSGTPAVNDSLSPTTSGANVSYYYYNSKTQSVPISLSSDSEELTEITISAGWHAQCYSIKSKTSVSFLNAIAGKNVVAVFLSQSSSSITTVSNVPNKVEYMTVGGSSSKVQTISGTMPSTLKYFSAYECSALRSVPSFSSCTNWKYGYSCFEGTHLITAPTLPSSLQIIDGMFRDCTYLTTGTAIPASATRADRTYYNCTSLTAAPENNSTVVTTLQSCFSGCIAMTSAANFNIRGNSVNASFIFSGCNALVTGPDITSVNNLASGFYNCHNLRNWTTQQTTSITLPSTITNLNSTFGNCSSLTETPNLYNTTNISSLESTFFNCSSLTTINSFPQQVATLLDCLNTFRGCTSLTTIPSLPNYIGSMKGMFAGCTGLQPQNIYIPQLVSSLDSCFSGVQNLAGIITLNRNISAISNAFNGVNGPIIITGDNELNSTDLLVMGGNVYKELQITPNTITSVRCRDTNGTLDDNGNYIKLTVHFTSIVLPNSLITTLYVPKVYIKTDQQEPIIDWKLTNVNTGTTTTISNSTSIQADRIAAGNLISEGIFETYFAIGENEVLSYKIYVPTSANNVYDWDAQQSEVTTITKYWNGIAGSSIFTSSTYIFDATPDGQSFKIGGPVDETTEHGFIVGNSGIVDIADQYPSTFNGPATFNSTLTAANGITIPNNIGYKTKRTDNTLRTLCYMDSSNNYLYGYDGYNNNEGGSYLYGNTINICSKGAINIGQAADNNTIYINGNITASGTISAANNAFTVDSSGNIVTSGNITTLNHSSAIGTVVSKVGATDYTTNISSGTETWKAIGYIEVTVGRYIAFARARFDPTNSGAHYSDINISLTSASNSNRDRRYGAGTYINQHSYSTWVNVTEDNVDENGLCKIYLNGYSNVAGNWVRTNVAAFYLAAMRIM